MLNATSSESEYDHVSRSVTISIKDCDPVPENVSERLAFLGESVQMMLGDDIVVSIEGNQPEIKLVVWPKKPSPPKKKSNI